MMRRFFRSEAGSALPIVGLAMFLLITATGVAIDMSRMQIAQSRLSSSLDAAGLAAGANPDTSNAPTVARNYFDANFTTNYLNAYVHDFSVIISPDGYTINLSVKADVPTIFMKIYGKNSITISAKSQITRASKGLELVLVMDNTGSMSQSAGGSVSKIQAAKTAATTLINTLYGTNSTVENLWVGLVPFSQAVNISTSRTSWLDTTTFSADDYGPKVTGTTCTAATGFTATYASGPTCTYKITTTALKLPTFGQINWQGCVESRSNGSSTPQYDITDDTPTTKKFKPYFYADDSANYAQDTWYTPATTGTSCSGSGSSRKCTYTTKYDYSSSQGPNMYCPQPLTPMTANKNTILAGINSMAAVGGTEIPLGLAWGWRMLSPKWRGLWGGEMDTNNLPLDYGTPLMNKVVILMTDGDNDISYNVYSAYGYPSAGQLGSGACSGSNCTTGETQLNTRMSTICTNMKAQGILIYSVALGASVSTTGQTLLKNCASKPEYYFLSPTTDDLQTAFEAIGDSLANLRVSQ